MYGGRKMNGKYVSLLSEEDSMIIESKNIVVKKIKEFLDFLYSNADEKDWFEIRILKLNGGTENDYYRVDDTEAAAETIYNRMISDHSIRGIYVTINTTVPDTIKHVKKALKDNDIVHVINFPIDLDVFHEHPPTREEIELIRAAVEKSAEELYGRRGIAYSITTSGFGFHVFIKLKPVQFKTLEEKTAYREIGRKLAEEFQKEVIKHVDKRFINYVRNSVDKGVYNLSRIMRVPWTINRREIAGKIYENLAKTLILKNGTPLDLSSEIEKEIMSITRATEKLLISKNGVRLTPDEKNKIVNIIKSYWKPGTRHNLALGLAALFFWRGIEFEDALEIIQTVAQETGDNETADRETAVRDTYFNAQYRNYKSYLTDKLIFELNSALKDFYRRALRGKATQNIAITDAMEILSGKFSLVEYLKEHTTDIVKEVIENKGNVVFKVTFTEENTGQQVQLVLKNTTKMDKTKMFYALNEDFMAHFGIYIVNPLSIKSLDRDSRMTLTKYLAQSMLDYYAFVTRNAREVISEEFEEIKSAFFDIIEEDIKGIVRINERSELKPKTFAEILNRDYFVYAEIENRIYFSPSIMEYGSDIKGFARNLHKFLKKKRVASGKNWREDRTSISLGNRKHAYAYFVTADKFFELLENEDVTRPPLLEIDEILPEINEDRNVDGISDIESELDSFEEV